MVLDPVLVCKETHDVAVSELCQELIRFFPYVSVITPNLPEAELLADQKIEKSGRHEKMQPKNCVIWVRQQ